MVPFEECKNAKEEADPGDSDKIILGIPTCNWEKLSGHRGKKREKRSFFDMLMHVLVQRVVQEFFWSVSLLS